MSPGAQRVQAVQGVVSPVSASSFPLLIVFLSLRIPVISETAVSDAAAFLAGQFLESLSYAQNTQSQVIVCQLQYLTTLCVWCTGGSPVWRARFGLSGPLISADSVTANKRSYTVYSGRFILQLKWKKKPSLFPVDWPSAALIHAAKQPRCH